MVNYNMKELRGTLEHLGLTSNESKAYLVLVKTGECTAGKIAKEAQINRTSAYDALRRLLDKGLISYVTLAKRKLFKAENPERIIEYLDEKKEDAKQIVPTLKGLYKFPKAQHNVKLFYGYKGMKSVFEDIIESGKENRVMDSEGQFAEKMPYYAPHFVRKLEKKKIKVKHLVRRGRDVKSSKTTEVRFLDKKTKSQAVINIYDDKVAIAIWTDPPEAVVIENKAVAESFKDYFEIMWKGAGKKKD